MDISRSLSGRQREIEGINHTLDDWIYSTALAAGQFRLKSCEVSLVSLFKPC